MTSSGPTREVHERRTDASQWHDACDLIVDYLEHLGVEYIFGIPGGAIEPLFNALARSQRRGTIRPVVARHETGAAFMADGYARETGKLGVCCATTGPGATNMITGVASAYQQYVPLLVLTAQTPLDTFGTGAIQESSCTAVNTIGMYQYCTRYNSLVSHVEQLEKKLLHALVSALRPPRGPAHLSIPLDILRAPAPRPTGISLQSLLDSTAAPCSGAPDALVHRVQNARRLAIIVGEGCAGAVGAILEFARLFGAPIVATPLAKGLINPFDPLFRGICGMAGHRSAKHVLENPAIDLVLVAGANLDQQTALGWDTPTPTHGALVHIDALPANFVNSPRAELHVSGDVRVIFESLLAYFKMVSRRATALPEIIAGHEQPSKVLYFDRRQRDRRDIQDSDHETASSNANERRIHERRSRASITLPSLHLTMEHEDKFRSDASPIKPQRLMFDLARLFPPGTRFHIDNGNSFFWATHYLHPFNRRLDSRRLSDVCSVRTSMGFASMGWAIGSAIGAALASPRRPVVSITGDGSFLMSGQELSVAVQEKLTVIFVVLNDSALGTVKHGQRLRRSERIAYELPKTNFAMFAVALGAHGVAIRSPDEMAALDVHATCRRAGPTVLDVHIDAEEVPPMADRVRMLDA